MALFTVGAFADEGQSFAPIRRSSRKLSHHLSHRRACSGGLPLLAMARCVSSERPDLAWAARAASAARAWADVQPPSSSGNFWLQFFSNSCPAKRHYASANKLHVKAYPCCTRQSQAGSSINAGAQQSMCASSGYKRFPKPVICHVILIKCQVIHIYHA